jgi:hypothetical protein
MLSTSIGVEKRLDEDATYEILVRLFPGQRVCSQRNLCNAVGSKPWEEITDVDFSLAYPPKGEIQTVIGLTFYRFTDQDCRRLNTLIAGNLARLLNCRCYCDGSGYGTDASPYWGLFFSPDGTCWLADDSHTDFADGDGGPIRLVKRLEIEVPPFASPPTQSLPNSE